MDSAVYNALTARIAAAQVEVTTLTARVTTAVHHHAVSTREVREAAALLRRDDAAIPHRERAVLVVDDDRRDRDNLVLALKERLDGVVVTGVESPAAAQVALQRTRYAVVVVDYHLGAERSGIEYARNLGRGPRPVVVTGRADVGALRLIARRIDVDVFERPITPQGWDELAAYVADQVERATE